MYVTPQQRKAFLEELQAEAAEGGTRAMTVRELIGKWNAKARGPIIVERIRSDLKAHELRTVPDFRAWGLDAKVIVGPAQKETPASEAAEATVVIVPPESPEPDSPSFRLQVSHLASAQRPVLAVRPTDDLLVATTLMIEHDYSQLAVTTGDRDIKGAITWEFIGRAQLGGSPKEVREAMSLAELVDFDADLLQLVPRIVESGFVFVLAPDRTLSGIVTTADLSVEFVDLATPFFLLGEIERRLRHLVEEIVGEDDIKAAGDRDDDRDIPPVAKLTMGAIERLLEPPRVWEASGKPVHRATVLESVRRTREIRNQVMHFSPDPVAADDVEHLRGALRILRLISPD